MSNHSILGNILCPNCGSDYFDVEVETINGLSPTEIYFCNDCGKTWTADDKFESPKPLKF